MVHCISRFWLRFLSRASAWETSGVERKQEDKRLYKSELRSRETRVSSYRPLLKVQGLQLHRTLDKLQVAVCGLIQFSIATRIINRWLRITRFASHRIVCSFQFGNLTLERIIVRGFRGFSAFAVDRKVCWIIFTFSLFHLSEKMFLKKLETWFRSLLL